MKAHIKILSLLLLLGSIACDPGQEIVANSNDTPTSPDVSLVTSTDTDSGQRVEDAATPDVSPHDVTRGREIKAPDATNLCTDADFEALNAVEDRARTWTDPDDLTAGKLAVFMSKTMNLSLGCATCFADHSICVRNSCTETCADDDGESCVICMQRSGCHETFETCSGLDY